MQGSFDELRLVRQGSDVGFCHQTLLSDFSKNKFGEMIRVRRYTPVQVSRVNDNAIVTFVSTWIYL